MNSKDTFAIKVNNLYKTFRIPQTKVHSLKEIFTNPFRKKTYRNYAVLKNIDFEIMQGDFVEIIGKNGSGKSTLLKILSGIYSYDQGSVDVAGRIVPFLELGVGFNPELTARENIFLNGIILGMTRKEVSSKFNEIVDFSELGEFLDVQIKNFSSGMYVRLAFAIAIQASGSIYILDEILSVGDYQFQLKCLNYINSLIQDKKTIIFVTHDLNSIKAYCNKVIYINKGKLVYFGETREGVEKYIKQTAVESDEQEQQIEDEEKEALETRGTQKAFVNNVLFKDKEGATRSIFLSGEDITVEVHYLVLTSDLPALNIGIAIWRDIDKRLIFGTNTKINGVTPEMSEKGTVQFSLKNVSISQGIYSVSTAIVSRDNEERVDVQERKFSFSITKSNENQGDFLIDTSVKVIA